MLNKLDELSVNTLRMLSVDMIEKANSGHPGLPLGAAPMAYTLWTQHLNIDPKSGRDWPNRDRFVLSAGHGSALLYSLLHVSGFDVSIDDLKQFRQWDSKTPGHPEVGHTDGVEATTGPLGQGLAMAVGMAMAEAHLSAKYNRPGFPIMDHYTYVLCGDGDLMEGISQEAMSLAGHLKLNKLIVLYDSNDISLDGPLNKAFSENVAERVQASGWHYLCVEDGTDLSAISAAITLAKTSSLPTLIEVKTIIGQGAPKEGTNKVHGAPLGEEGIKQVRKYYDWQEEPFQVPDKVYQHFNETVQVRGALAKNQWETLFSNYEQEYPELAQQFKEGFNQTLPNSWADSLPSYEVGSAAASRVTSKEVIQSLAEKIPFFWGGSADLASSNNTMIAADTDFSADHYEGRNIWYGVREFGMAAAMNGIALHGGTRTYAATFFVFVDYLRAAVRLSALQQLPVTYVLTHDSIAVGEDGPTHEPVEQLASLRAMPNVNVIRPADGNEVVAAWKLAIQAEKTPTILALSRQNLPVLPHTDTLASEGVMKGAYVLSAEQQELQGILIASGSEVALAIEAQKELFAKGIDVRVVSMPCMELFHQQSKAYQEQVLPSTCQARVAIEMGSRFGWHQFVFNDEAILSVDQFGASAPGGEVIKQYGFTVDHILDTYQKLYV